MSQEICVAATNSDYKYIIREFENHFDVKYLLREFKADPNPVVYASAFETKSLGFSLKGNSALDDLFYVYDKSVKIIVAPRPQEKGGVLYQFGGYGPMILAYFGGLYKDECLVMGSFAVTGEDKLDLAMFRYISRQIRKKFCRVGFMWLGPEAFELYKKGMSIKEDQRYKPILPPYEVMEEHIDPKHLENLEKLNDEKGNSD